MSAPLSSFYTHTSTPALHSSPTRRSSDLMAMLMLNDSFHQTWESQLGSTTPPREEFWHEATQALPNFIWIAEAYSDSEWALQDRKSTRLNSSHLGISYAVFCLKKKTLLQQ